MKSFKIQSEALREQLIAWRRDFHQHPELAFEEIRTAGIVADVLRDLGLEVQAGVGKTGVVAVLEGDSDGPTVLVRADMDALPIHEANQADYISHTANKMHACGHDGHTSIALAVATMLTDQRQDLKGRVKFVFQPAEEIAGGALAMINDGVLLNPKPDVAVGLHLWNDLTVGQVGVTDGPSMAGSTDMTLVIHGKGGHGASPHQTHDPVICAAQIITAAQTIVSRNVPPLETAVISFTTIHGGDAFNVIPASVTITGTIRAYKLEIQDLMVARVNQLVTGIAEAMGCTVDIDINTLTPPVYNNPEMGARLRQGFVQVDDVTILDNVRTMGAEDVAFFLQEVPGVYFFVGSANHERGLDYPHHHPQFDVDEDALVVAANLLASAVGEYVLPD